MKIVKPSVELLWCTINPEIQIEKAGRTCFSEDTELLTENGWKLVTEITKTEKVLTYNQKENILEYQISNIFCKAYNGVMIGTSHRLSDFLVTPDHRMVATKISNKGNYKFVKAKLLANTQNNHGFVLPLWFGGSGIDNKDYTKPIILPEHVYKSGSPLRECVVKGRKFKLTNDFLTIIAAYISDGHINGGGSGIVITKKKGAKLLEEVKEACATLNFQTRTEPSAGRNHITSLYISGGKPISTWFEKNCGRGSLNKHLPPFFRKLSKLQIEHFINILHLGDGINNATDGSYASSSKELIDQVNELYILSGRGGNVISFAPEMFGGWTKHVSYQTRRSVRDSLIVKPKQITQTKYNALVFCPQTNNGIVCCRKNGKQLWIGNCYKSEDKITEGSAGKFVKALRKAGHHAMLEHACASFRIITDRGITHEIVRHRIASYAQESTRYCSYNKDKFGNECSFIQPPDMTYGQTLAWKRACESAEAYYFEMINSGCTPQIARSVLPNCLKTEIVMMANLREFRHFIKLRGSKDAHPQIRPIAFAIWDKLMDIAPNMFEDLTPLSK